MTQPTQPGNRPATTRATPTATSRPRPDTGPGAMGRAQAAGRSTAGQDVPGEENYQGTEGQTEGGSSILAQTRGQISAPPGASAFGNTWSGLGRDIAEQSIRWHAHALMTILGVNEQEMSEVLHTAADSLTS